MKFSIIIPVYNVEEYIEKCLSSIHEQTYQNFEAIIVNDGTLDNSVNVIKKFIKNKKNFKMYSKENGGLSDARNFGLKYVTGDYILFVDSDDYLNLELLSELNKELTKNKVDIIKFGVQYIEDNKIKPVNNNNLFHNLHPNEVIRPLLEDELFEPAWLYCYKKDFWFKHNFLFTKGRVHEDFGLTPLVLMNAKKISCISYIGYNYVIRNNSIMTNNNEQKLLNKYNDYFIFYKENIPKILENNNIDKIAKKYLCSYYANGMINKVQTLKGKNFKEKLKELKSIKIFDYMIDDTLNRKLKKFMYKHFTNIFIKED